MIKTKAVSLEGQGNHDSRENREAMKSFDEFEHKQKGKHVEIQDFYGLIKVDMTHMRLEVTC